MVETGAAVVVVDNVVVTDNVVVVEVVSIVLSLVEAAGTGVVLSSELEELCIDSTILATALETLLSSEDVIKLLKHN